MEELCRICGEELVPDHHQHPVCEGCAIDEYEKQQVRREQAYLEDDRNWERV